MNGGPPVNRSSSEFVSKSPLERGGTDANLLGSVTGCVGMQTGQHVSNIPPGGWGTDVAGHAPAAAGTRTE